MAKGKDNGITILLGLKDYKVGEVWEGEDRVIVKTQVKGREKCPHCGSARSMGIACVSRGKYSIPGAMAKRFTLSSIAGGGSTVIVSTPLLKAGNWCGRIPSSPERPKLRPCGSSRAETSVR